MGSQVSEQPRIVSLDQFRGYTVFGMFFVNFVGHFRAIHPIFQHHNTYCSYADTIMPHFFFAVGFAYRLTLLRRLQTVGPKVAYGHAIKRNLGLILLGIVIYHLDGGVQKWEQLQALGVIGFFKNSFQREVFQTLVHIAITSLWIMPVIAAGPAVRICFVIFSGLLHLLLSYYFYFDWVWHRPGIDGGPLGFLTWSIPALVGSLAYDAISHNSKSAALGRLLIWGSVTMVFGYALSCFNLLTPPNASSWQEAKTRIQSEGLRIALIEPPFTPPQPKSDTDDSPRRPVNMWTMSQRAGSNSYLIFSAGLSLVVYALFILLSDLWGLQIGIFRTLGTNALAGYILHEMVAGAVHPFSPKDSPLLYALATFAIFLAICYLFLRYLEKNKIYLKL